MRLLKSQREKLLEWVSEGLLTDEINRRAAQHDPAFRVSTVLVNYYRKTRAVDLAELAQADEFNALTTGLAIKANRVARLQELAELLAADILTDNLWVEDVKGINNREVKIEKFNASEVDAYRGVLDDIAKEMGDRRTNVQHSGDPEQPVEVVHIYIPDNGRDRGT